MGNHEHNHDQEQGCCGGHDHSHEGHDHQEGGCGCGHDHGHESKIYLTMDGGKQVACHVLDIFTIKEQDYIAVLPEGEEDVFIYRYEDDEENPQLSLIEDEDEFNLVSQAFLEKFQELEE